MAARETVYGMDIDAFYKMNKALVDDGSFWPCLIWQYYVFEKLGKKGAENK